MGFFTRVLAESATPANPAGAAGAGTLFGSLIPFVLMIVIFYFILIRPQRKKEKSLKALVNALAVGDEIVTIGGIYGKVTGLKDDTIIIESGNGTEKSRIKVARWAVKDCLTIKE